MGVAGVVGARVGHDDTGVQGRLAMSEPKIIHTKWGPTLTPRGKYYFSLLLNRLLEYEEDPCEYRLFALERAISVIRGEPDRIERELNRSQNKELRYKPAGEET